MKLFGWDYLSIHRYDVCVLWIRSFLMPILLLSRMFEHDCLDACCFDLLYACVLYSCI